MASNELRPITRKEVLALIALLVAVVFLGIIVDTSDPHVLDPFKESSP